MPAYRKFNSSDLIFNRVKTYPNVEFFVYDRKVYYNNKPSLSGAFTNQVNHVPSGYISLYEENVDRSANNLIYPFLIKDSTLSAFKSVSTSDFNSDFGYGDVITGSYPLSSSISVDKIEANGSRSRITSLQNTLNFYQPLSPHYSYNSSLGDKSIQKLSLVSIPSIFFGSSIKKGSMKLDYFVSGSLIGRLEDIKRNGELVQTLPVGSTGSGSIAGVCLYNEGFLVLTGAWDITNTHTEVYDAGSAATYPKWYYFASTGSSGAGENIPSSSFSMKFDGVNYINTMTAFCHAPIGQVNCSNNPTWIDYGQNTSPSTSSYSYVENENLTIKNITKPVFTGDSGSFEKTVYINKILLYDQEKRVIGIANLSQPIRKREVDELVFKLKLDLL